MTYIYDENLKRKVNAFAVQVEADQTETYIRLGCEAQLASCKVSVIPGSKYTKVDVGLAGKYMVVNETGEIFGIKAYGVIHRGYRFGTLDTIGDWWWGEYRGIPRGKLAVRSLEKI